MLGIQGWIGWLGATLLRVAHKLAQLELRCHQGSPRAQNCFWVHPHGYQPDTAPHGLLPWSLTSLLAVHLPESWQSGPLYRGRSKMAASLIMAKWDRKEDKMEAQVSQVTLNEFFCIPFFSSGVLHLVCPKTRSLYKGMDAKKWQSHNFIFFLEYGSNMDTHEKNPLFIDRPCITKILMSAN